MEFQIDKKLFLKNRLVTLLDSLTNESYISSICEKYIHLLNEGSKPSHLVESLLNELNQFNWNNDINSFIMGVSKVVNENSCSYSVANFIKTYGFDSQSSIDGEFKERLNRLASSLNESDLRKEIKFGELNFYSDIVPEFRYVVETAYRSDNENPSLANANIKTPIVPMIEYKDGFMFHLANENYYFEPHNNLLEVHNGFPDDQQYLKLVEASKKFKMTKESANYNSDISNLAISIKYLNGEPQVNINGKVLKVDESLRDNMIYSTGIAQVELNSINLAVFLAENYHRFVELDFAQTISSELNESNSVTFFKLGSETKVISYNKYTQNTNTKTFTDINECVDYVNSYTGYNMYESLDNMFGNETVDLTKFKEAKEILLEQMSNLVKNKQKLENSGLVTENKEISSAHEMVSSKISLVKSKIMRLNQQLGIRESFEEDSYIKVRVIGRYRSIPVGAIVKVDESAFTLALTENPVEAWMDGEKIFIPKKFLAI